MLCRLFNKDAHIGYTYVCRCFGSGNDTSGCPSTGDRKYGKWEQSIRGFARNRIQIFQYREFRLPDILPYCRKPRQAKQLSPE